MRKEVTIWQSRRYPDRYLTLFGNRRTLRLRLGDRLYWFSIEWSRRAISFMGPARYTLLYWPFRRRPYSVEQIGRRAPVLVYWRRSVWRRKLIESGPVRGPGESDYRPMRYILIPPAPRFIPACDRGNIATIAPIKDRS